MKNREKVVSGLTNYLRSLSRRRGTSVVTADDAQRFLDNKNFSGNQNERLSVIRSVLREPTFSSVGFTPSSREAARGRTITTWTAGQ